jgi:Uma2 family endonuclease
MDLSRILDLIAKREGFIARYEFGVFDPVKGATNYRVPDLVIVDPQYVSKRGLEGRAELVVEILSPDDESRDKFDFYAMCQVQEVWIADPETRVVEVYALRRDRYFQILDEGNRVRALRFGLDLEVIAGPKLKISWADGSAEI